MRDYLAKSIFFTLVLFLLSTFGLVANSPAQQFPLQTFICTPIKVGSYRTYTGTTSYPGKVWVQCNPPLSSNQKFFAVPLGEAAEAARFLSLFTAAFVAGKTIEIGYISTDTSGATFNCTSATECWPAISANIR